MDVRVRQATLQDQERIGHFLQAAYGDRAQHKFPERWVWEYVSNPFWDGDRLPIWIAEIDEQIVGQLCNMMVRLKLVDKVYPAAWGVDMFVLAEYRCQGIGMQLLVAHTEYHEIVMGVDVSPITRRGLASLGHQVVDSVTELCKTLRVTPEQSLELLDNRFGDRNILSRMGRKWNLARVHARFLTVLTLIRDSGRLRVGSDHPAIERIDRFDQRFDQLWTRLAPCFPVVVQRDAAYLNWKFVEQPDMKYDAFAATENGMLRGYVITRTCTPPEAKIGIIADLFAAPDDHRVINALLVHAVRHLRRAGVFGVIAATSVPDYVTCFLQLGFRETKQVIPMVHWKTTIPAPGKGWFLSMGDHDWDQFPLMTERLPAGG